MTNRSPIFERLSLRPPISPGDLEAEHNEQLEVIRLAQALGDPSRIANGMRTVQARDRQEEALRREQQESGEYHE
jgi:hypothetical protein